MESYSVRQAILKDIQFIIETIIEAEKSGTDKFGLATLFNLTENEIRRYLKQILDEKIEGCEFSLSSFLVVENEGKCVAAVGGWCEGENEDKLPSSILKANLLSCILPKESILHANEKSNIIKGVQIEREPGTYQIEYVYVVENHRGHKLTEKLINDHIKKCKNCKTVYVQVFANNTSAISSYKRMGFQVKQTFSSNNDETTNYLPYHQKLLMQKDL